MMLEGIAEDLFQECCRAPLLPAARRRSGPWHAGDAIERLLPHRSPFLFVDRITHVARTESASPSAAGAPGGTIVCRHDPRRAAPSHAVHSPGRPLWPGALQVDAIGQAGLCLFRLLEMEAVGEEERSDCVLTDILAGRYLRPVVPDGVVEIVARILRDGLFLIVVGQCLKEDLVCSAAALRGIERGVPA